MNEDERNLVIVGVRYLGDVRWFQSEREMWLLDLTKWQNSFVVAGFRKPEIAPEHRFGMSVVDEKNGARFIELMKSDEMDTDALGEELQKHAVLASSWWDAQEFFPIMFADFDEKRVSAFYPDGPRMEQYIPDGWTGQFCDFAVELSEKVLPISNKYWIREGVDILSALNAKGALL